MAVMLSEHAFRTDYRVTDLTEVFYLLVLMFETEDLTSELVGNCTTSTHTVIDIILVVTLTSVVLFIVV
jgi:hypothetical protein